MIISLYPHGGSSNHGCEAIVRATAKILHKHEIHLFSSSPAQDRESGLENICLIHSDRKPIRHISWEYIKAFWKYHWIKDKEAFECLSLSPLLTFTRYGNLMLSIGGDVYCYGHPRYLYIVNRKLRSQGVKTVLWGCSIEPDIIQGEMLEDLKGYSKIIARESITYGALVEKGLKNVLCYPDPAFLLPADITLLPPGFSKGNVIGLNVSPLIIRMEQQEDIVMQNYSRLIDTIICKTDMLIALIPHVVWIDNDDREPLRDLYNQYKDTNRIMMIEDCNAEQLKGIISCCRFMVSARTHASIAAYSSHVPTLTVGYSVKAQGIAIDIFGTAEHYVIPVESMKERDCLTNAFNWMMAHEEYIRQLYSIVMPIYVKRALDMGNELENL